MNSLMEDDITLPLDFNGSTNPEHLRNAFMDETAPQVIMKAGSGRMSPALTRTMKEYDQLLSDLKKENFSLKLRIYFLEEKTPKGDAEMFRTNIELKVEVETLKKDLMEKQEL